MMKPSITALVAAISFSAALAHADSFGIETLELKNIEQGWGEPHANKSVDSHPLFIDGKRYEHGLGTHAESVFRIALGGTAESFSAVVGVDVK